MTSSHDRRRERALAHEEQRAKLREQRLAEIASAPAEHGDPDDWFTPGRFALIFGVLVVVCFPQVVFGFETFFFRDFGSFTYPLAFFQRECFWRGELPFWNPYSQCGVPFLAQWNTAALYPPTLFYLLLPLTWSLGVFMLAHLMFAALGMYFLAYRWTGNRMAASVAGTVFGFNGLMWYMLMWTSNLAAEAWMPWVVLAAQRLWQTGGRRNYVLASFAGAMQMLTGSPEGILLTWLLLGALWLVKFFRGEQNRLALLARFLAVPCLVAGLAAVQLLPFLDLLEHSQRSASYGGSYSSMARTGWANYLVPLFHYFRTMQGTYAPREQNWAASYYLGTATIALALLAVWLVRDARTFVLTALSALCLVLALGESGVLFKLLTRLAPAMGFLRYPIKFVMLPTFLLPLLAARGVAWLQSVPEDKWAMQRRKLAGAAAFVLAGIAVITVWAWIRPAESENRWMTAGNALVRAAFLVLIVAGFIALRRITEWKLQLLLRVSLLLLFWFDILTHAPSYQPTVTSVAFAPDAIRQWFNWDFTQLQLGDSRAMSSPAALDRMSHSWVGEPTLEVNGRRLALWPNYNILDHVPSCHGFVSLEPRDFYYFHAWLLGMTQTNPITKLNEFLGVSQITDPSNTTNPLAWVAVEDHLPAITAGQEPVFVDDVSALKQMAGDDFAPARQVLLPREASAAFADARHAETKFYSRQFTPERVEADLEAAAPTTMVVSQTFYHRWRAYVDDKPTKLWRANFAFQALEVPAGRHAVRLIYEDPPFDIGLLVSLGTLALCGVVWFLGRKAPPAAKAAKA